jgi:hypothetical protein
MSSTLRCFFAAAFLLAIMQPGFTQIKTHPRRPICHTSVADSGYYMKNAEQFLAKRLSERQMNPNATDFSAPYTIRVFIRIVRQNNGTLPGCTVETAIQNFNEMNGQYNGHNICFQLAGIDFINDSYLNNFNIEDSLDTVYPNYIRNNNLDVNGAMTIFVHYNFLNNSGSSGNAYGIPNNFLSVARWAVNSTDVHSIFGHEMGHCLGLYHTHEKYNGSQESVTRNVGNSCYNCHIEGDLCCDTPADYPNSDNYTNSVSCVYSRNFDNSCDDLRYNPSTINIMSYHPWDCISSTSTALTTNQRTRMHATINDPSSPVNSRVAEDNLVLNTISRSSNAVRLYTAKFDVTTANGATISHTVDSKAYYAAGTSITFGPGVTLSPGANGVANASISGCN